MTITARLYSAFDFLHLLSFRRDNKCVTRSQLLRSWKDYRLDCHAIVRSDDEFLILSDNRHSESLGEESILNAFSEIIHYIVAQNDVVGLLKIS